ncbi:MAG: hypothetical protein QM784_28045 [Polyangiaceae bacterium]
MRRKPSGGTKGSLLGSARLTPAQKDEVMRWLMVDGLDYAEIVQRCAAWGVRTSDSALSQLRSRHGLHWKLEQAQAQAQQALEGLPGEVEEQVKLGLLQQLFRAFYGELTAMDLGFLARAENDRQRLKLQEEKLKLDREKFAAAQKKEQAAKKVLGDGKLTDAQKAARMKEVYGINT